MNNDTKTYEQLFDLFIQSNSSKSIKKSFENLSEYLEINIDDVYQNGYHLSNQKRLSNRLCSITNFNTQNQTNTRLIYKIIKSKTNYWKSNELWKKYDKKANSKEYFNKSQNSSTPLNVLIIGCGPVGLRLSIECALLGFKVTVIEKRDRFSRNNVLHLWPYTIHDLKTLGAKLFYGKFCAGSLDHISIRKLQCILLKIALLMGVQVHFNTSFEQIIEPEGPHGWRFKCIPENHPVGRENFDAIIGADGRRNSLPGFNRKEFRGRLAIGITANFINYNTTEEVQVEEISGVASIFKQQFFLDLKQETGIDLENIVYYKDDTHYFVMTAKRNSLLDKQVILGDYSDASLLLSKDNVNFEKLCEYAKEAAYCSTNKQLSRLDFAKNHYGQPDVAMFDFTSLFHSENASRIVVRNGRKLLMSLVGDSLLEPFWPLGTGIARGFLAVFDTAWQLKGFANERDPLELLCERENIYQLLSQTTHDNLSKNYQEFTIDPTSRYVNLNLSSFKKEIQINDKQLMQLYDDSNDPIYSPKLGDNSILVINNNSISNNSKSKRARIENSSTILLHWAQMVVQPFSLKVENFQSSWKDGLVFLGIISRYRPELIDYNCLNVTEMRQNLDVLFGLIETNLCHIELDQSIKFEFYTVEKEPSKTSVLLILDKLYNYFKNEPILESEKDACEIDRENIRLESNRMSIKKRKEVNLETQDIDVNGLKRRGSLVKSALFQNKIDFFNNNANSCVPLTTSRPKSDLSLCDKPICYKCGLRVFQMDRMNLFDDVILHTNCFKCEECTRPLRTIGFSHVLNKINNKYSFYCSNHVKKEDHVDRRNFELNLDNNDDFIKYSPRKQEKLSLLNASEQYFSDLQRENCQKRSDFYLSTYKPRRSNTDFDSSNYSTPNTSFTSPSEPSTPAQLRERAEFESILESDEANNTKDEEEVDDVNMEQNDIFSDTDHDESEDYEEEDEEFFSLDTKYITLRNSSFKPDEKSCSPSTSKSKSQSPFSESSNSQTNEYNNNIIENQLQDLVDVYLIRKRAQEKAKLKSDEELGINSIIKIKKLDAEKKTDEEEDEVFGSQPEIKRNTVVYHAPLARCETLEDDDNESVIVLDETKKKKLIHANLKLSSSSNTDSSDELSSSSLIDSFNALNVENSPRLSSRKSPFIKFNKKRLSNEEKKLEKQKQDKRFRMSQELQRKHDELREKIDEFTRAGVDLERKINRMDPKSSSYDTLKKSYENQMFDLIHRKNVLVRIENELVIQCQALGIEDKLSECRSKLKETIDIPEHKKTIQIKENEKSLMERLVDLIEEKNNLVEQLEMLKLMENEEDKVVLDILSKETNQDFKNSSNDLLDKFKSFSDII